MVKKITITGILDFSGPETIFKILFGDDEFIRRFHKKFNQDPDAEASSWNANNERDVKYVATTQAPKVITRVVGDSFKVKEKQKYTKIGNCYTITCSPQIDTPIGDRVSTQVETILVPDESSGGCVVTTNVILQCKGIWGLDGTIETFMEAKTRVTFEEWMTAARLFCEEKLALTCPETDECFFDANDASMNGFPPGAGPDEHPTPVNRILNRFKVAFSGTPESEHGFDAYFIQTVLRDINDIQISCDALKGHLEKLNAKMLNIEHDIASIKSALQTHPASSSFTRSSLIPVGMGMVFSTGLLLAFYYVRSQKQQT